MLRDSKKMTLYEDFCAFCNEIGEELPTGITRDGTDTDNTLEFCKFLYTIMTHRNITPCVSYPDSTLDIVNTYHKLVKQWYSKNSKMEEEEPVSITFRWVKDTREKTFNVICSFERAMILTDMLGSTDGYEIRLERVCKWLLEEGKTVPKNIEVLQIIADEQILNITL